MPVFNNAIAGAAGSGGDSAYTIERSLRFESAQNSYLERTFKGGDRKRWTWSGWIKRAKTEGGNYMRVLRANPSGGEAGIHIANNNRVEVYHYAGGGYVYQVIPTFKLKDESAWYHVLVSVDTTIASPASDRVKVWINGDRKTEITTANYPSQGFESFINDNNAPTAIGGSDLKYDGLMADVHFLDGIAVTDASLFGKYNETTGVWDPIEYEGNHNSPGSANYGATLTGTAGVGGNGVQGPFRNSVWPSSGSGYPGGSTQYASANNAGATLTWNASSYNLSASSVVVQTLGAGVTATATYTDGSSVSATSGGSVQFYQLDLSPSGTKTLASVSTFKAGSSHGFAGVKLDGDILQIEPAGVNGCHLDFKDNSSTAALGFNAKVSGTRYSNYMTGSVNSSYPYANLFDGDTSTFMLGTNGAIQTWTPATGIAWTDSAGGVEVYFHNTSSVDKVRINGGSWVVQQVSTGGWEKVSTGDGTLTKMEFSDNSGQETAVYAIRINGTILTDPAGANDFTPYNFSVSTTDVTHWRQATGGDNPSSNSNGSISHRPFKALTDPQSGSLLWDHQNTQVFGLQNITGISSLRLLVSSRGNAKLGINTGSMFSIGSVGGDYNNAQSQAAWYTVSNPPSTLTSIAATGGGSGTGNFCSVWGIEVNGTRVVDIFARNNNSFIDTPTDYDNGGNNVGGNYCILNPKTTSSGTFSNSNLRFVGPGAYVTAFGTMGASSGKWYYEVEVENAPYGQGLNNEHNGFGWATYRYDSNAAPNAMAWSLLYQDTGWYNNFNTSKINSSQSLAVGDILSVAVDFDAWTFEFKRNGTSVATGTIGGPKGVFLMPCATSYNDSYGKLIYNFGQRPFKYAPGSTGGPAATYKALCTTNLPDPTLDKPSTAFTTRTYTGKGNAPNPVGGPVYSATSTMSSAAQAFDGNVTVGAVFNSAGKVVTTSPITIKNSLEIYHNRTGSEGITVTINGTDYVATGLSSNGYHSIPFPSGALPLTSSGNIVLKDNATNAQSTVYAIRVDGHVLADGQGTPTEFKPGLAWLKARNSTHYHFLHDDVRGSTKALYSNRNDAQYDYKPSGITSFDDTGFTVNGAYAANYSGTGYTAWLWNMGTYNNTFDSSLYNQDQVWSTGISGSNQVPNNQAFDGDLTTWAAPNGNSVLTWKPSYTLSVSSSMRVYAAREANGDSITVYFSDGTSYNSFTADNVFRWYTVTSPAGKTIDRIEWSHSTSKSKVSAIEIDGKILVDAGYVAAGSLNSSAYDQSETWSSGVTSSAGAWPGGFNTACGAVTNGFNGNTGNGVCATGGANIVWNNPQSTSTLSGTLEFYNRSDTLAYGRTAIITHAGGTTSAITLTANSVWQNLGTYTGITTITITGVSPGGGVIDAIRVNGKLLVDNGYSVDNVPSVSAAVKANQTAGMSIATYTATGSDLTAPHGLLKKPEFIILKSYDENSRDWLTMASVIGEKDFMKLNLPNGNSPNASNVFLGTSSTTFKTGNDAGINTNLEPKIAYCFHSVPGVSKIGTYTGNQSAADGPFVDVGFKPAFLMHKRYDTGGTNVGDWRIWDAARDPDNPLQGIAIPNGVVGDAINSAHNVEFMSNGFRILTADTNINANNAEYLYIAFAEHPFKYSRGR